MPVSLLSHNQAPTAARPYVYELFAVLVHSGSAMGGHYYAYIKAMTGSAEEDGKWHKFNDSTVTASSAAAVCRVGFFRIDFL